LGVVFREIREYATGSLHDGTETKRATNYKKARVKTGFGIQTPESDDIRGSG
jgi:hypothetical protein